MNHDDAASSGDEADELDESSEDEMIHFAQGTSEDEESDAEAGEDTGTDDGASFLTQLQSVLVAMGAGRRQTTLEGQTTEGERARLDLARGPQQLEVRIILAISCARVASLVRQLPVQLPEEMILAIAQEVCRWEAQAGTLPLGACSCEPLERGRATLSFASPPPPACRAMCCRCGGTSIVRCTPRVRPLDGGQWHDLYRATLAVRATFKDCRHFHIEPGGTRGPCAVRHRMSGLHSFRTIVAGEWLLSGAVTYEVRLDLLRAPLAVAVGCVTPRCAVNGDVAWAPGTRGCRGAWGVAIEGCSAPEDEPAHEIRALPEAERVQVGGQLQPGGGWRTWPISADLVPPLLPGDVLRCTLDATRRLFSWQVVRSGVVIAPYPTPAAGGGSGGGTYGSAPHSGGPSAPQPPPHSPFSLPLCCDSAEEESLQGPPPLALAVALKFAGDTVSLWRVAEGEADVLSPTA